MTRGDSNRRRNARPGSGVADADTTADTNTDTDTDTDTDADVTPETLADVLGKRHRVLAVLAAGPVHKRDLVDRLDVPRTTLDRAVRELTDAGLAERAEGGVRATAAGRAALSAHETYRDRLDGVARGAALLDRLPPETTLSATFLAGAEVSVADAAAPDRVVSRLVESARAADDFRGLAPVALAGHLDAFDTAATAGGTVPELVVDPAVLEHLLEVRGRTLWETLREDAMRFRVAPLHERYGLWLAERDDRTEAGVLVYTDTGVAGVAVNDRPAALEWARERYERASAESEPVTAESVARELGLDADVADVDGER